MTTQTFDRTQMLIGREPVHLGPTWELDPDWDGDDPWSRYLLPERTLGWQALAWIRKYVNDEFGQPFQPTFEQSRFILWWYAVDERGRFTYRNGVLQRLKGWLPGVRTR